MLASLLLKNKQANTLAAHWRVDSGGWSQDGGGHRTDGYPMAQARRAGGCCVKGGGLD